MIVGRTSTYEQGQSVLARPSGPHSRVRESVSPNLPCVRAAFLIQTPERPGFCAALGVGNPSHTDLIAGLNWFSPQLSQISTERGCGRLIAARTADRAVGASGALAIIQPRSGEALGRAARRNIVSRPRNFVLTHRLQPASDPMRQGTDRSPVGRGSLHEWDHDRGALYEGAKDLQGVANDSDRSNADRAGHHWPPPRSSADDGDLRAPCGMAVLAGLQLLLRPRKAGRRPRVGNTQRARHTAATLGGGI